MEARLIGLGPAYDITFALKPEGSVTGAEMLIRDFSKTKFLERGVRYLGPSQKLRSGYTSFPEGYAEKIKAVVVVKIQYRSATDLRHSDEFRIDFSEIEGTSRLGKPHLYAIAQSLDKIRGDLQHLSTGFRRLRVDVYDSHDRKRERAEIEEQIAQEKRSEDEGTAGT